VIADLPRAAETALRISSAVAIFFTFDFAIDADIAPPC
jgi:hypothetical protein